MNFIQNKNLGFDEELLVTLDIGYPNNRPSSEVLKSEFESISSVSSASLSYGAPGSRFAGLSTPVYRNDSTEFQSQMDYALIDKDFLETFNMNVVAGENFRNTINEITTGVVVNESSVQALGWSNPNQAIGKSINTHYDKEKRIIAVVEDFHYESVHNSIQPLVMVTTKNYYPFYNTLTAKLNPGDLQESIEQLEATWASLGTGTPLQFQFMDDRISKLYDEENRISKLFYFFAFIAIIISSVGLLGLTAFSAERRTKEIGIRKVLGATVSNIVALLSKDFILLVLIGFAIAIPIAWYAMNQWLADFAYRIEIGPGIFAFAGGAALIIALLTVSWQSIKAAVANPVDSLRSE